MQDEEIKKLLEENKKLSEEINKSVVYIRKYILFSKIFSVIKIFIIIVPLILSFIYLPRFINDMLNEHGGILNKLDINKIINLDYLNNATNVNGLDKNDINFLKDLEKRAGKN